MKFPATDIEFAMQAEIDELKAENARLRKAIEAIAFATGDQPEAMNMPEEDWYRSRFYNCVTTASRALSRTKKKA